MHEVFISFSSKDRNVALNICKFLEDNGISCWIAPRNVDAGTNYATQIVSAIKKCRVFVLAASVNTNESGHVSNEVSLAFDNKKPIIPFKIEDFTFTDEYLYFLGRKHWIEAHSDMEAGLNKLKDTINTFVRPEERCSDSDSKPVSDERRSETNLYEVFDVTKKYLKKTFAPLLNNPDGELEKYTCNYSALFSLLSEVRKSDKETDFNNDIIRYLLDAINSSSEKYMIKISGNNGSEKNAVMQLLYLNIYSEAIKGNNDFAPFYINLPYYEKQLYDVTQNISAQISEKMDEDLKLFKNFIMQHPDRKPLIFIDGIRDFIFSKISVEHLLYEKLAELSDLQFVVSLDTGLTINKKRLKKIITFASKNFQYNVKVSSLDLIDEEKCFKFYKIFSEIYGIDVSGIHEKMKKMSFYEVDVYLLRLSAGIIRDNVSDPDFSISDLFEAMCLEMLNGNTEDLLLASEAAYDFAYNETDFSDKEVFSVKYWTIIKRHKYFLDFLISYYYIYKLTEFGDNWDMSFSEQVLPKEVTRFITPRLNDSYANEEKIIQLVKKSYSSMGNLGKSEMTFWLGRIKNPKLAIEARRILMTFYEEIISEIKQKNKEGKYQDISERKADLFLLRGITVSLIYSGVDKVSEDYITYMINEDLPNNINRGFHLEYYGDKPYLPNKEMLDFEDDVSKGEKTLKRLVKNIEQHFAKNVGTPILELDLFTMCSLLQARIAVPDADNVSRWNGYIKICVGFLEKYQKRIKHADNRKISSYFNMVSIDFRDFLETQTKSSVVCSVFNTYSRAADVKRTGWVNAGIPEAESIVEHMYTAWLFGMLNLPQTDEYHNDYSKDRVLQMLLIHDLGETITGDIPKPEKIGNPVYDNNEDDVMRKFFLKGTYPGMTNLMEYYSLWEEWYEQETYNSRIAKDLDTLQAMYQFCVYYLKYPDKFSEEKKDSWLAEYRDLKTEIGFSLYETLIRNNTLFREIFISR